MNGHIRLNSELNINETATVQIDSSGDQFRVRRDDNCLIVRSDSPSYL